jgi:hypothetical protein
MSEIIHPEATNRLGGKGCVETVGLGYEALLVLEPLSIVSTGPLQ